MGERVQQLQQTVKVLRIDTRLQPPIYLNTIMYILYHRLFAILYFRGKGSNNNHIIKSFTHTFQE